MKKQIKRGKNSEQSKFNDMKKKKKPNNDRKKIKKIKCNIINNQYQDSTTNCHEGKHINTDKTGISKIQNKIKRESGLYEHYKNSKMNLIETEMKSISENNIKITNDLELNQTIESIENSKFISNEKMIESEETIFLSPQYTNTAEFEFENTNTTIFYSIPKNRPVRIYCDGVYDMFHYGHMRSLMQAKKLFPNVYLMVGVTSDNSTVENKGKLIMNEKERYESLRHCKYVDEVIEDAPWILTNNFLELHKIDFVCHDDIPYKSKNSCDIYKFLKEQKKFIPTRRTLGISTSDIITRIVRDYDTFVRRQLERGIALDDLNLSFFKKESIIMKKKWKELENDFKNEIHEIKEELRYAFLYWEKVSNDLIRKFNNRFTKNINEKNPFNKLIRKILLLVAKRRENIKANAQ